VAFVIIINNASIRYRSMMLKVNTEYKLIKIVFYLLILYLLVSKKWIPFRIKKWSL